MNWNEFKGYLEESSKLIEIPKPKKVNFFGFNVDNRNPDENEFAEWERSYASLDKSCQYNDKISRKDILFEDGFGDLVRGDKQMTKGDITYNNNPTTFYSVGPDAVPYEGPIRVSKFSQSPDIDLLGELKRDLEVLERRVHFADVKKTKKDRIKLTKKLRALRKKCHELSEKIQSKPDTDVT